MKLELLQKIAQKLSQYKKIHSIERVADSTIKIAFDKDEAYFFNLQRGDSYIYKNLDQKKIKTYSAPFDVVLKKQFTNAKIDKITIPPNDKILQLFTTSSSKYKSQTSILQFEFTGRHTNIIILNDKNIILEALRHIDISNSFREVRVGVTLLDLPEKEFRSTPLEIGDLDEFLINEHKRREEAQLKSIKKQKLSSLIKKLKKLKKILNSLDDEELLLEKSQKLEHHAGLILANINNIKNYQSTITLKDYDGSDVIIELPKGSHTPANGANMIFKRSKKLKQKAKNSYIEKDNLKEKIEFLDKLIHIVDESKSIEEIELYLPKQPKNQKNRDKKETNIENFFFQDYKISLGKSEKGNIALLKDAKMSDFWLHLKDMPSTHVIIRTSKKTLPEDVVEFAAKLCVNFSINEKGRYLVDYTQRRNVKMRDGANVNYIEYKTISVEKD
jgi:predicted ribosome quality control (RQC) complex YloA/Tae2 family protein